MNNKIYKILFTTYKKNLFQNIWKNKKANMIDNILYWIEQEKENEDNKK